MEAKEFPLARDDTAQPVPSTRTQVLFSVMTIAGVVLFMELLSALIFYVAEGKRFSYKEQAERRQQLTGDMTKEQDARPFALQGLQNNSIAETREIIHPFLGFTFNPDLNERENRKERDELLISRYGFFQKPNESEDPADLRIGIFGGSVALLFCFQGQERLLEVLSEAPGLEGKRITVDCRALGGYKQPQQLIALTYALTLGEHFDAVINIDGFNEVALSSENYQNSVTPHYPRQWKNRVEILPDIQAQWLVGRVVFIRQQRAKLARRFSGSPWRSSVTINLIWRFLDRWLVRDLMTTQLAATEYVPVDNKYLWQGPFETYPEPVQALEAIADMWQNASQQMHHLATSNGMYYLHFLQPNQYDSGSKPMSREEKLVAIDQESPYIWAVEEGYPLLRQAGDELRQDGVRFFDFSEIFKEVAEPIYSDNCCHFNARGNALIADAIGQAIRESLEQPRNK